MKQEITKQDALNALRALVVYEWGSVASARAHNKGRGNAWNAAVDLLDRAAPPLEKRGREMAGQHKPVTVPNGVTCVHVTTEHKGEGQKP